MCTCVCTHVPTHAWFALALGIKEKAPSTVLFSFVYLTPFLPSPGCFCLGRLQRAHRIPAIKNDVFITVTTKDIACPPTLPPVARSPSAAIPSSRSASSPPLPLPALWGGTLCPCATGASRPPQASLLLPCQEDRCCLS